MTAATCKTIRPILGALLDGELCGADMLRAGGHLEHCHGCSAEFDELQRVGEILRVEAQAVRIPSMPGLVDSVVTRVRAEEAQSWRGLLHRGADDWRWAIVGVGSVTATCLVAMIATAVLWFGPAPARGDSLAAVLNDLGARPPVFVVWSTSGDWDRMLARIANGDAVVGHRPRAVQSRAAFFGASEEELTGKLTEAFMNEGRFVTLDAMPEEKRRYTEALLDQISDIRAGTSQVRLMTSLTVNASGP